MDEQPITLAGLTARELEVIKSIAEGLVNKEIAVRLQISERTVKFHIGNLYFKLGLADGVSSNSKRVKLLRWAFRNNL